MKISEFKQKLSEVDSITFELQTGERLPKHFHITEVGVTTKHFIDCGGDIHEEKVATLQIWSSIDFYHRLAPESLIKIIDLSDKVLQGQNLEIEVEYDTTTIGKYNLEFKNNFFILIPKFTNCLAKVKCDIPQTIKSCCSSTKCC